ncbi:MAG: hypothetical protein B7X55_00550 [Rhodobacterales bacterium 34-62-10]|nr:MAG: hypothetical protein B7X55_00550 [Rhodobacterales bacterium 34-62-10]
MTDTVTAALYLRSAVINDDAIADQRARCTAQVITVLIASQWHSRASVHACAARVAWACSRSRHFRS